MLVFEKLTHKELQRYVVHEDMIQWDYTQLAKICSKFHSINFLQKKDNQGKLTIKMKHSTLLQRVMAGFGVLPFLIVAFVFLFHRLFSQTVNC